MKKPTSWKRIWSLLLTLSMVFTMTVTALPVYAAGSGTISVKYNPDVDGLDSTNFKLYKVGKYGRADDGESIILLEDAFSACAEMGVTFDIDPEDAKWQEEWLAQADILGQYAKNHEGSLTPAWADALSVTDAFQPLSEGGAVKSFENGIYLLVGEEKLVGEEFWAPVPVLIQVLNGNSEFTLDDIQLKMDSRARVHKHTVTKTWQDDGYSDGRPGSVRIAIFYGSTQMDTVEMSNEKGWVYTWYSYLDKKTNKWIYTSKNPEDPADEGVETEKLNEGNSFELRFDGGDSTWGAEEIAPEKYAPGENKYMSNAPQGEPVGEDAERFDVINTVVLPVDHDPPVTKVVNGDKPKKAETFEFSLTAVSTDANIDEMPMPEGADGDVNTMKVKAGDLEEFGDIVFRIPGEYVYEIREVDTGKKGYKYDSSVYRLVYNLTVEESEPGVYQLVMDLTTYKNGKEVNVAEYSFVNEYTAPPPGTNPLTGDNTNILLPAAAFAAALVILILFIIRRRKNGKDDN